MSIRRWMDKKAVVHIHNGVLLSHYKEYIWISSVEMDETGADYTEWSKQERKTSIQYTNTYIWNLERWQWWPCMQDSKRDTDVYSGLWDSEGEGEGGMIWENGFLTCILSCKNWITSLCLTQDTACLGLYPLGAVWPRGMLWGGRWEGGSCLGTHVRIKDFKIKKK